jgi:hypothetical protein
MTIIIFCNLEVSRGFAFSKPTPAIEPLKEDTTISVSNSSSNVHSNATSSSDQNSFDAFSDSTVLDALDRISHPRVYTTPAPILEVMFPEQISTIAPTQIVAPSAIAYAPKPSAPLNSNEPSRSPTEDSASPKVIFLYPPDPAPIPDESRVLLFLEIGISGAIVGIVSMAAAVVSFRKRR